MVPWVRGRGRVSLAGLGGGVVWLAALYAAVTDPGDQRMAYLLLLAAGLSVTSARMDRRCLAGLSRADAGSWAPALLLLVSAWL